MNSVSIPIDLFLEILSRLPAKSVARCQSVSKRWASILDRPHFKELFLTKSSARPRLLFAIVEDGMWSFFSLPQRHNPDEKSLVVAAAAEFHVKFPPDNLLIYHHSDQCYFQCGYASGLIYFYGACYDDRPVIFNPSTGRYATLPYLKRYRKTYSLLGFDPVKKQFKVLFMGYPFGPDYKSHRILTLDTEETMRWRKIKCSLRHEINSEGICINGVLYYLGATWDCINDDVVVTSDYVIVCFDVRSEQFKMIDVDSFCKLINYNGKLGVIYWEVGVRSEDVIDELRVWILEDVEKQEWSENVYTLNDDDKFFFRYGKVFVVGGTATGEIVFSMREYTSKEPFYVYYFNPERKNLKRVEIQGFGEYLEPFKTHSVYTFVDYVEDLNVNDPKLLKSSINAPYVMPNEEDEEDEEDEESESE